MRSSLPKVLHRVAGRTLVEAVLDSLEGPLAGAQSSSSSAPTASGSSARSRAARSSSSCRIRRSGRETPPGGRSRRSGAGGGPVLVLSGDTPLLTGETLARLVARAARRALRSRVSDLPAARARRLRARRARRARAVRRIVEAKNASARQKRIGEVNAGVYCFARGRPGAGARADPRRTRVAGEYYLTDAVEILAVGQGPGRGDRGRGLAGGLGRQHAPRPRGGRGDGAAPRRRARPRRGRDGARSRDRAHRAARPGRAGRRPAPLRVARGETTLEEGCEVLSFTRLVDTRVEAGAVVGPHCEVEEASIGPRARVGPFSRLRPGSVIEEDVRVGNFVETKNTRARHGAPRRSTSPTSATRRSAPARTSGRASSRATTTARRSTRRRSARGPSSAATSQLVAPVTVGAGAYVGAGHDRDRGRARRGPGPVAASPQTNKAGWVAQRKAKKPGRT